MSKQKFVERWRHEIDGWILDAALTNRTGAELSIFLRSMRSRIELKLEAMYDDMHKPVAVNGQTLPSTRTA